MVVVEATPRSGSLSTAKQATDQNREVFALPSPVDNLSRRGCHHLIRDGARLVETVDYILGDRWREPLEFRDTPEDDGTGLVMPPGGSALEPERVVAPGIGRR